MTPPDDPSPFDRIAAARIEDDNDPRMATVHALLAGKIRLLR
jgi:hypothetical protein